MLPCVCETREGLRGSLNSMGMVGNWVGLGQVRLLAVEFDFADPKSPAQVTISEN